MSVAQLYYHLAPRNEVATVAKALVRLLRGKREVQAIVLQNIASMTLKRKVGELKRLIVFARVQHCIV